MSIFEFLFSLVVSIGNDSCDRLFQFILNYQAFSSPSCMGLSDFFYQGFL